MQGRKRTLTEPFEPNTNPFGDNAAVMTENVEDNNETDGNRLESKPQALVPPALNIVPPESSIHSTEEKKGDEYNGNDKDSSLISNIFRTRVGRSSHENLSRPKLSLKTASFGAAESSRRNVSPSTKSAKSSSQYIDLNDERLRRRSFSSYSRSSSRRVSNSPSSTDRPPRSAKVLSLIAADDMDDFEDLQKGFKSAIDEEGLTWLPQLKSEKSRPVSDVGEDRGEGEQESIPDVHTPNVGASATPGSIHLTPEPAQNGSVSEGLEGSINNSRKKPSPKFFHHLSPQKEDKDQTEVIEYAEDILDFETLQRKLESRPFVLYGHSLGVFSPTNPLRIKIARFLLHRRYSLLYNTLLTFYAILLAIRTYNPHNVVFLYRFSNWTDYFIFILSACFTGNDIAKIIAFGFWDDSEMFKAYGREYKSILQRSGIMKLYIYLREKYGRKLIDFIIPFRIISPGEETKYQRSSLSTSLTKPYGAKENQRPFGTPRAFARSSWNRIDLVSSVSFWLGMFLSIRSYDTKTGIRIFKPLAILRILRLVNVDTGMPSILRGLKYGIPQLVNVSSMLVYFWIFFGILGVQIFQGSFRRQCVWFNPEDPTDTYQYDMQFCGGYLDPVTKRKQNYIYEDGSEGSVSKGFLCPQYSKCVSNANPYNGRISFDNIVNSMELVFVIMSANTFTDLMYYTMDSDEMAACLFFIVCIFVLTIWLLNLLIAVLVSSFEIANEEYKKKKFIYGSRKTGYVARIVTGYWKYFKLKANQTKFPNWSQKGLAIYSHVEFIFVILIICDIGMRASVKVSTSANYNNILLKTDRGISIVLFIESLARLVLYLPNMWKFLTKPSYVYDFIISIITLVISCLAVEGVLGHMYAWLSIFHISRFYRVIISFKLTKKLWKQILSNGVMIWNLSSFYFFFTFLVAIIMAVYFEGVIPPEEMADQPFGMYSLPNSFLSLFIIGSTENWTDILYALQKHSPNISSAFFCSVFFIIWFLLSNSVILNIFIALISESMEVKEEEKRPQQIKHYLKFVYPQKIQEYTHASLVARIRKKFFGGHRNEDTRDFKQFLMRGTAIMNIAQNMGELADEFKEPPSENLFKKGLSKLTIGVPSLKRLRMFANNPFYKNSDVVFTETNDINGRTYILELNEYEDEKLDYLKKYPLFNYSYYFFSPQHRFRRFCQRLVPPSTGKRTDGSRFFEDSTDLYNKRSYFHHIERDVFVFIFALATILLIVCSCYVTPLYRMHHKMGTWNWSSALDCAFIGAFSIEFIVKTVADGFIYAPNAYLRNPWNFIDFCVLISMWINLIAYLKNNGNLSRIFKGLTALRALRCLTISNTARQTFNLVMFDGLNKIFEAGLISLSLLFPFTVWGLSIFKGRLGTCNDGSLGRADCYNEYSNSVFQWDIMSPRVYQQPYLHLDSFASAFNSLYQIVSLEGWVDLLENMMNSSGIGTPATVMGSAGNALFLVLFNFLSMVFILNLFVSFIVNNQARTTGSAYFTIEEKAWLESQKLLSQAKPKAIPNLIELSRVRQFFYQLAVEKKNFYYASFLQVVLYLHIIMLLSRSYNPGNLIGYQGVYFMFSTSVFLIQEALHMCGEGPRLYFRQKWNSIRLSIIIIAFIMNAVAFHVPASHYWFHNIKGFFLLVIFLFIIPQNDTLTELLETAMASLPPILSLTYTWGVLFLVYAIALNQIFGLTRLGSNTTDNINFRTVIKSMIVLFRCSFGEGWNYIMADLTVSEPYCSSDDNSTYTDCGSETYAYLLLMSWNIISMYIFVNMFVSLIIGNFSYVYRSGGSRSGINRSEIKKYIEAWSKFDTDGTGELELSYLPRIMHSFDGPLSFKIWEGRLTIKSLVENYMEVNPDDPYDVKIDLIGLNKELNTIDKAKIIQRKLQYRRFVQSIHYTNAYNGCIRFSDLLLQIPLYTAYSARECLGIDQYVHHLYILGKVDKYLENQRNFDVLEMVVTRWKFHCRMKRTIEPEWDVKDPTVSSHISNINVNLEPAPGILEREPIATPRMDYGVNNFMWSPRMNQDSTMEPPEEPIDNNDDSANDLIDR